ncbi:MAG: DUF3299 domain-containing protein [Planctomycetota bacterium]
MTKRATVKRSTAKRITTVRKADLMVAPESRTQPPAGEAGKASAGALACIVLGGAVMALAIACGGEVDVASSGGAATAGLVDGGGSGNSGGSGNAPQGRSFTDVSPIEERPDLVIKPTDARLGPGVASGQPVGLSGLQASVDPSMLTPEALAKNPLEIGVEKKPPFELAPGADPLDPNSYDWDKDKDGYWIISFSDLSLTGVDRETVLDALVYPEEYEDAGDEIQFPDRVRALDGERVALTGYMIALRWNKNHLKQFMLVRDLKSCCFGQQPEADEWVDVVMKGEGTYYVQFVPVVTRGTFRLTGSSDEAGYAVGAYRIDGDDTREE